MLERQAQGVAVSKKKEAYKGKPLEYSTNAKDKSKMTIDFNIIVDLKSEKPVSRIAPKYDVTKKLIYRIKGEIIQ